MELIVITNTYEAPVALLVFVRSYWNENFVDRLCISKPGPPLTFRAKGISKTPVLLDRLQDNAKEYVLRRKSAVAVRTDTEAPGLTRTADILRISPKTRGNCPFYDFESARPGNSFLLQTDVSSPSVAAKSLVYHTFMVLQK